MFEPKTEEYILSLAYGLDDLANCLSPSLNYTAILF